jgi:hypothetical protein
MKRILTLFFLLGLMAYATNVANAQLIGGSTNNGNLDRTHADEVVPGFFLPKPNVWVYSGSRTITGPYQDGLSSEPWAGPAPTPVTTDGTLNPPPPDGCDGPDCAVFFKAFTGDGLAVTPTNGFANVNLTQTFPSSPGLSYLLTGWAGAEANFLGDGHFAIDFLNGGGGLISSADLLLNSAGLFVPNGQPFNYKQYSVLATAPAGTASLVARVSMLNATGNPAGGGQAFVVDDFTLGQVPEPTTVALGMLGVLGLVGLVRRR